MTYNFHYVGSTQQKIQIMCVCVGGGDDKFLNWSRGVANNYLS